jgi:transposase
MVAPTAFDGSINGARFLDYVQRVLAPTLMPGDIVVIANLSSHKRDEAREAIEAVGASVRFLPPYSPDFNPIEKAFAKLKALLRTAAARTVEALRPAATANAGNPPPNPRTLAMIEGSPGARHCPYRPGAVHDPVVKSN